MKAALKGIIKKTLRCIGHQALDDELVQNLVRNPLVRQRPYDQALQGLLALKYKDMVRDGAPLPHFSEVELRAYSQNGEDGILLYLFALLGTTNKRCVEICAGDGTECNTANLIINHGWAGLLVDGSEANVAKGQKFYAKCPDTFLRPPAFRQAWITRGNVNSIVTAAGFAGPIDLLSLDIDGVDYWVWEALDCIQPRVVVLEYAGVWGPEHAVTVPYRDDFRLDFGRLPLYGGASLAAFVKLGRKKGYRLVGSQRLGFNAFFVRAGVGEDLLPEVQARDCLELHVPRLDWGEREWLAV
jgi:hypothetical protein